MKIFGLCGQPGSGKTTIMRNFLSTLGGSSVHKESLVVYTMFPAEKVIVAGIYDENVFSGTDRLSKGCGPSYREWLKNKKDDPEWTDWRFYWEGERFSNSKFFDFFYEDYPDSTIYMLEADEETLNKRNEERSNQNDSWRKGMATRMKNLSSRYPLKHVSQGFTLGQTS
jgi:hypothetical protein